tara:strand:+ start:227 stop:487 length:261 start_codon:yes stop_codon:yes gene_type:complete
MLIRRIGSDTKTAQGFRSAFRDLAGNATQFALGIAEQALAHRVDDATEPAYRRSDALEKRRRLLGTWADFCGTTNREKYISLTGFQ